MNVKELNCKEPKLVQRQQKENGNTKSAFNSLNSTIETPKQCGKSFQSLK